MSFWIQHGHGKAKKIDNVDETGLLTGVVLSPADEDSVVLESTVEAANVHNIDLLLDPQLYIHTISGAVARCHNSHDLDFGEISFVVSPREIGRQAETVVALNRRLGIDRIIAPSPYQVSFGDVWTPLSLQYAQATIDIADSPVYISLVVEESAFSDWDQTIRYLEALTTLDAAGIYLIVGTPGKTYPISWVPDQLANILRAIYILSELNHYEFIWGYSDIVGTLGLSVGASGAATGWYNSLRMWTPEKWRPQSGGRQANPRIFVAPLLSVIERYREAVSIARTRLATEVFPDQNERRRLTDEQPWGIADSWNQYLNAMAQFHQNVDSSSDVSSRLLDFRQRLQNAIATVNEVRVLGLPLDATHSNRLNSLVQAIDIFTATEDL